jgi:hemerythrin-like domain-containing protein
MKATKLLEEQHRKVEATFEKLEKKQGDVLELLTSLANDLAGHMAIEQTIFYPAVRQIEPDLVDESYQEHAIAELALKRLLATKPDDPTFKAKVTALKELIEHHVDEEEEDLFPTVEKQLEDDELEQLGKDMSAAFEEAVEEGYEALLPEGLAASGDSINSDTTPRRPKGGQHRGKGHKRTSA